MADAVKLAGLAIGASLDAGDFTRGAQQVEDGANKVASALHKAGEGSSGFDRIITERGNAFDRLRRTIDPTSASMEKMERAQGTLNRALEQGRISQDAYNRYLELAQQRFNAHATAVSGAASGHANFTNNLRNAGFQIQDFAVQVQGGTSALTAMGQQAPQLLSIFGTAGIIAGAAVPVALLIAQLLGLGAATEELSKKLERQDAAYKSIMATADAWAGGMEKEMAQLLRLQEYYKNTTQAVREFEAARIKASQNELARSRTEIQNNLTSGAGYITQAESGLLPLYDPMGNYTGGQTGLPGNARTAALTDTVREFEQSSLTTESLARYFQRLDALAQGNDKVAEAARSAAQAALKAGQEVGQFSKAEQQLNDQFNALNQKVLPIPPGEIEAPAERAQARARGITAAKKQTEILYENLEGTVFPAATMQAALAKADALTTAASERRDKQLEKDLVREEERREKSFDRTVQQYSSNLAQGTVDALFDGASKGQSVFASLANVAGRMLRSAFAAALDVTVFRPLISELFGMLGFGGSSDGSSGLGLSGGGAIGGIGQALGIKDFSLSGLGKSIGLTGEGGLLNKTLWTGSGGAATTVGGVLGGAALGFGAGSMLNSMVGGNSTGGMVGSGIGSLAGAAIGSIIPGVGTVIGGLVGGAAGGMLGGLFGGGKGVTGGDVIVQVGANGLLEIGYARGKNWDQGAAIAEAQKQVAALNEQLQSRGLFFETSGGMPASVIGSGESTNQPKDLVAGFQSSWVGGGNTLRTLRSNDPNARRALESTFAQGGGLQQALENVDWVTKVYEPLTRSSAATSEFQKAMTALWEQFAPTIAKAQQLGLATNSLSDAWSRAANEIEDARNRAYNASIGGMTARSLRATGQTNAAEMLEYNIQAEAEWHGFYKQLQDWGVTSQQIAERMAQLERVHGDERVAIAKKQQEQITAAWTSANDATGSLWGRLSRVRGDTLGGALQDFDQRAAQERRGFDALLKAAGSAGQDYVDRMTLLETTLGEERLAIVKTYNDQIAAQEKQKAEEAAREAAVAAAAWSNAAGSAASNIVNLSDYIRGLSTSDKSPLSATAQHYSSGLEYNRVLSAAYEGDAASLSKLPGLADTFLAASRQVNGSGTQYAQDYANVIEGLGGISTKTADQLTASFLAAETRTQTATLQVELQGIAEVLEAMRLELQQNGLRPDRAA